MLVQRIAVVVGVASCGSWAFTQPVVWTTFDNPAALGEDSSGNGNDADIVNSPAYTSGGISEGAAELPNGAHYFAWVGETNPVEDLLEGDFTFTVWIKTTQTLGGGNSPFAGAGLVYADISGIPPGPEYDAVPIALTGGRATATAANTAGFIQAPALVNTGEWVHLAVTRDVDGFLRLYVDGELAVQDTSNPAFPDLSGTDFLVLGGNTVDNRYYQGLIDEFMGYDRPLTPAEVRFLYLHPGELPCSSADLNGDGNLNNTDINGFVNAFLSMVPLADMNGDGNYNNTDVNEFVNAFLAGCE